jgi:hypothetical protein
MPGRFQARKTSAFGRSHDGHKAAKKLQCTQEKLCEKNTHLIYRLSEPHKPISGNAEKSFKRENYHLF